MSSFEDAQTGVQRQAWSESERQEIRDYAEANPQLSIEVEIYDCTRVAHPSLTILRSQRNSVFINPASDVIDGGEDDRRSNHQYLTPADNEGPICEPPPAPPVSHPTTIDNLETLLLYFLQSDGSTSQLEELLQRERRRSEGYLHREKGTQTQRRITEFLN